MNINDIKKLLEAFYRGEITLEEEKELKEYFAGDNVVEELEEEKEFFTALYKVETIKVPESLKQNIETLIDGFLSEKTKHEEIQPAMPKRAFTHRKPIISWLASIAALLVITLCSIYFGSLVQTDTDNISANAKIELRDTYSDSEIARKEAQKALILVSQNFNKGIEQAEVVSDNINKVNKILNKKINNKEL